MQLNTIKPGGLESYYLFHGASKMCFDFGKNGIHTLDFKGPMSFTDKYDAEKGFADGGEVGFILKGEYNGQQTGYTRAEVQKISSFADKESKTLLYNVGNLKLNEKGPDFEFVSVMGWSQNKDEDEKKYK